MISPEKWRRLRLAPRSAGWALLNYPFVPRTAALRSADVPLRYAYWLHWIPILLGSACALLTTAYVRTFPWPRRRGPERIDYIDSLTQLLDDIGLLNFVLVLVGIEVFLLMVVFLLLPWAAQPEPLRQTIRRTFRTVWLSSSIWGMAFIPLLLAWLWEDVSRRQAAIPWPNTTTGRIILKPDSPWILHPDNADLLGYVSLIFAFCWTLWGGVRALRTPTNLSCPVIPPTCETCGYNLSYLSESGKCPECGTPTNRSLDPNQRAPIPWESAHSAQGFFQYFRVAHFTCLVPKKLFLSLPILTGQHRAQRYALSCALGLAAIVYGFPVFIYLVSGVSWGWGFWIGMIPFGVAALLPPLVVPSAAASLLGLVQSRKDQRNQLLAAAKAAFYNADFIALWGILTFVIYFANDLPYRYLPNSSFFRIVYVIEASRPMSARMVYGVFLLVGFAWYLVLVRRAMRELRFANR